MVLPTYCFHGLFKFCFSKEYEEVTNLKNQCGSFSWRLFAEVRGRQTVVLKVKATTVPVCSVQTAGLFVFQRRMKKTERAVANKSKFS